MAFQDYVKLHEKFYVRLQSDNQPKLPPGHYQVDYIRDSDQLLFERIKFTHDDLLELPSDEFKVVSGQIDKFLSDETKQKFKEYGFLYKRSVLMHGVPGTGKTCLANRIANKVVNEGGIVLFNPDPGLLTMAYKALNDIQPETNLVVIFEELDKLVKEYEDDLLSLLDGEIQRENIIYLATTNYISKVPARIMRPGRFSSVVEIKFPDALCRKFYLDKKIGHTDSVEDVQVLVDATDGFSIDEVKEVVLSTKCLDITLDEVVKRIKETKELCKDDPVFNEYDAGWGPRGGIDIGRNKSLNAQINKLRKGIAND